MKVNSQIRTTKQGLKINIPIVEKQINYDLLNKKYEFILTGVDKILNRSFSGTMCYQELYNNINDVLLFELPDEFIRGIEILFIKCSEFAATQLIAVNENKDVFEFFQMFNSFWNGILKNFGLLRKILTKFEKKIFNKNYKQKSIWNLCKLLFNLLVIENLKINLEGGNFINDLIERLIFRINDYRETQYNQMASGDLSDIGLAVSFLNETGLYKDRFNEIFINVTTEYYKNLSDTLLTSETFPLEKYIIFVENSIKFEGEIISTYLNEISLKKVLLALDTNLLLDRKEFILSGVFNVAEPLDNQRIALLARIFELFKRVKIDDSLKQAWLKYINFYAEELFKLYSKNSMELFSRMFTLKKNIDVALKESFKADEKFKLAAKEGFTKALNLKPNFAADFLSRYIDHIFEETDKGENYILEKIDEFMIIFKYLDAKDMFEQFYIRKLSARLLYNLTNSKKGEHHLIERLKHECGVVFVTKAEEMINDMNISQELTLGTKLSGKIGYNFYILSSNSWPVSKIIKGFISPEIEQLHNRFVELNSSSFTNKTLAWHLPYCTAEIIYRPKGRDEMLLEVNGIQATILIKFTGATTKLDVNALIKATGILKEDIIAPLNYLVNKITILKQENGSYMLNPDYKAIKHHVIINNFNENEETNVSVIFKF
jgi:hypothetical protein